MPEIQGVWFDPLPQAKSKEEIKLIQKKASRSLFAYKAINRCRTGISLLLSVHSIYCVFRSLYSMSYTKDLIFIYDSNSYAGRVVKAVAPNRYTNVEVHDDVLQYYDQLCICFIFVFIFFIPLDYLFDYLQDCFIGGYDRCTKAIIANDSLLKLTDYKDIKYYDKMVNINTTDVCPISCVPVAEIEQKVFYRKEVYEYYYLMNAYSRNPKGRDHTGQLYDTNEFYRVDDNNIKYIHVADET